MSYTDQLETQRRFASAQSSAASTPRGRSSSHTRLPRERHPRSFHQSDSVADVHPQHRSSRSNGESPQQRTPWNNSVRTDGRRSGGGAATGASTLEVHLATPKRFSSHNEAEAVRRRLATSLDGGAPWRSSGRHTTANTRQGSEPVDSDHWGYFQTPDYYRSNEFDNGERPRSTSAGPRTPRGRSRATARPSGSPEERENFDVLSSHDEKGETPTHLYSQLQDVVVKLTKSAVDQKKKAAQSRRRLEAYARLVKEQDTLIDELRRDVESLENEKEALMEFRRRGLSHEAATLGVTAERGHGAAEPSSASTPPRRLQNDDHVEEWLSTEYIRCNGRAAGTPRLRLPDMPSGVRRLLHSLATQLWEERERRRDVEDQSSRMIGKQQLALARAEARLAEAEHRGRRGHGRHHKSHHRSASRASSASVSSSSSASSGRSRESRHPEAFAMAKPSDILHSHGEGRANAKPPLPPPGRGAQERKLSDSATNGLVDSISETPRAVREANTSSDRTGLSPGSPRYEDAEAILADIRKRYGL